VSSPRGRRRHVAAYTVVCTSILYSALRSAVDRFTAPFIGSQRLYSAVQIVHGPVAAGRGPRGRLFAGRAVRRGGRAASGPRTGARPIRTAPPADGLGGAPAGTGDAGVYFVIGYSCVYLGMRWRDRKIYQVHRFPAP
jgi:hypothetical protein